MRGMVRAAAVIVRPQGFMTVLALLLICNSLFPQGSVPLSAASAHVSGVKVAQRATVSALGSGTVVSISQLQTKVDCKARPCIALSFDDGPNAVTPQVLDTLEQKHVGATFFIIGKNVSGHESLLRRMTADGFEIGNHTWDHKDMTTLTPEQVKDELIRTQTAIAATGAPVPTLFRPPYGAVDDAVVSGAGLQTALWNEDPRDWQATDPVALQQNIVAAARPDGVVDLHDIHPVTAAALPGVIDQLRAQGYQFVTVSQLMHSRIRPAGEPFYGYKAAPQ